jgi:nucleoside-diphosphate-sugar epimerase
VRILFTGGAGFIGSITCKKLIAQEHKVVAFDNFSRKSHIQDIDNSYEIYDGDIRYKYYLDKCIEKYNGFDAIWHFAYINGTERFYSNPELVLDVGIKGAINTLDAALKYNIKNYVLASTSEVYQNQTVIPTPETEQVSIPDIHNPRFSYSGGKIASELLAIHYGAKQGLNVKIMRPHNVYGANMGTEHVIPQLVKKILESKNNTITIQGFGTETRAFCYIDDAVEQMILSSFANNSDNASIYNIGVEQETKIVDLANIIADILGKTITINSSKLTDGSTNRRCPSMKKLSDLGYTPKYSLYDGLKKTVEWYKEYYEKEESNERTNI